MTGPLEAMACATCLSILDFDILEGNHIHPLYLEDVGHPPVPVPARHLDTIAKTCDFCGDLYPMWSLQGGDVTVLARAADTDLLHELGQNWGACVTCMVDIDAGRPHRIIDRALHRMNIRKGNRAHADLNALHAAFLDGRQPGRTLITTTRWPDLQLSARDLPKVRDRLTRFYRGPDELPTTMLNREMRHDLADSLDRARLYWVDDSFTNLADHAASQLPEVTASRDLAPCDDGLLIWSHPVSPRQATAASWSQNGTGTHIVIYRAIGSGLEDHPLQRLRDDVGWLAPMRAFQLHHEQLLDDGQDHPASTLLTTWLLIAQKAAETPPAQVDKGIRKAYARAKRPLPDVRVVRIRSHPQRDDTTTGTTTGAGRTYTNRVWVTGHWRNQAYGKGRALRRPTYIEPFLRGPEDTPIKLSTTVRILNDSDGDKGPVGNLVYDLGVIR